MKKVLPFFTILFLIPFVIFSQTESSEDDVKKRKFPVTLNGNLGISLGTYRAFGIENRRDPFQYQFTSNINFNILNRLNIPVGALLGQQELPSLQPFNQMGFSPTYKWVKSHVGFRTMQFSPYTLNAHTFLGGGLELELPTKKGPMIEMAGLYGRFRRKVELEDALNDGGVASFRRMGWGGKIGISQRSKKENKISFMMFHATDEETSIATPIFLDDENELLPGQNLVLGVTGEYRLLNKITLKTDYGTSAYTRDLRTENLASADVPALFKPFRSLYKPTLSTQFKDAIKAGVEYQEQAFTLGANYERIDPGYITMGSYFFQNDLENITLNGNLSLREGKITLGGSLGRQKDNLEADKSTRNQRLISSLNYTQMFTPQFTVSAGFSNYSSDIRVVRDDLSDSLNLYQISTNFNVNTNYVLGTPEDATSIYGTFAYQIGNQRDEYRIFDDATTFWLFSGGYRTKLKKSGISLTAGLNYNNTKVGEMTIARLGPTVTLNKEFLDKKIRATYAFNFNASSMDGVRSDNLINNRFNVTYKITEKLNATFGIGHFYKNDLRPIGENFSEFRGLTSIMYTF